MLSHLHTVNIALIKIFTNNVFSLNVTVAEAEKENSVKQKQVTSPQIFSAYIEQPRYQVANALEELNKRIYEHDKNITLGGVKEEVTLKVICSSMYCNRLIQPTFARIFHLHTSNFNLSGS